MTPDARRALPGLAVIGVGASIAPLDFAVNVAFPAITAAFSLPTTGIRWAAVCYVLTYGALMLAFGALGDRIGYLRVFRAGVLLGALAFTLCTFAPAYPWLLAARAVQGVAVALALSCAPALATLLVDERERTWALAAFQGTQAIAGIAAPLAGGLVMAVAGWQGVFAFRVPIALAAFAGLPLLARAAAAQRRRDDGAFDVAGSALLAASVALLLLGPALLDPDARPWPAVATTLAGCAATVAFVRRQRRLAAPIVPREAARDGGFVAINVAACAVQLASFAAPLLVPYYLLRGGGWSPVATGALLSTWAAGTLAASWGAPRTIAALGAPRAAVLGAAIAAAGLAAISGWGTAPHAPTMIACLVLQGAGLGLFQVAHADAVVAALPPSSRGVAGSIAMVARTVGVVIGATGWTWPGTDRPKIACPGMTRPGIAQPANVAEPSRT
jgi:MFS family permease